MATMALLDKQEFGIGIYRGSERIGKIRFHIGIRAAEGEVTYSAADQELRRFYPDTLGQEAKLAVAGFDAQAD